MTTENSKSQGTPGTRAMRLLSAGPINFAVAAEEIESIVEWRSPAPLPNAPAAILGVVCVHSRMLTVIAVSTLLGAEPTRNLKIVSLLGEQQIALAVESVGELIENQSETEPGNDPLTLGEIVSNGLSIPILNSKQLFPTAMRGRERRKRQF
jgi:chemotaxis signal transduction protein